MTIAATIVGVEAATIVGTMGFVAGLMNLGLAWRQRAQLHSGGWRLRDACRNRTYGPMHPIPRCVRGIFFCALGMVIYVLL